MSIFNLKPVLILDAATCAGIFLLSLAAAAPVAGLLGLPVSIVTVGGLICLASALLMAAVAAQRIPSVALTKLIALGNLGWVAASFAVIAAFAVQMSGLAIIIVAVQAFGVLGFAILEWKGAAALPRAATA